MRPPTILMAKRIFCGSLKKAGKPANRNKDDKVTGRRRQNHLFTLSPFHLFTPSPCHPFTLSEMLSIMNTNQPLDPLLSFIDEHLDQPLSVEALAQQVYLSRYHFIRSFQRAFHQTPHQYLMNRRIDKAKELLATSALPVTEICLAVGFESLGSFSTLFRNTVGWPPSVYRARVLEQRRNPYKFIPGCMCTMYGLRPTAQESNFEEAKSEQACYSD